jgi:putative transposase
MALSFEGADPNRFLCSANQDSSHAKKSARTDTRNGEPPLNADWVKPHEEYLRLGRTPAEQQGAYRRLFRAAVSGTDLREIRQCTHKGWALGGERFREQVEALAQRRAASKGVGRPRKGSDPV